MRRTKVTPHSGGSARPPGAVPGTTIQGVLTYFWSAEVTITVDDRKGCGVFSESEVTYVLQTQEQPPINAHMPGVARDPFFRQSHQNTVHRVQCRALPRCIEMGTFT